MIRIGVFVCWCGSNIAGTVDVGQVAEAATTMPNVVYVEQNKYMCSEPGQDAIRTAIRNHRLNRVVVAACSPRMHELTFRKAAAAAGLNSFLVEMANIREHCSWVHPDKDTGTPKAIDIVRRAVYKVAGNQELTPGRIPVNKRALVIGGGIAGIQAALDIADTGHKVVLVEKEQTIGGRMAQLDKTFPTLDCSSCILTPKMVEASNHPNISIWNYSEVEKVDGYIGSFKVTIRRKARDVNYDLCNGCGDCWAKCPAKLPSEFDLNLGQRKSIYVAFPQAVPNKPILDRDSCWYYQGKAPCKVCARFCGKDAITFDNADEIVEEDFGAIVVATGYKQFETSVYGEYGYGRYPDVITGLEFERLVNSSGPTDGKIRRPSDGKEPKNVVFVQCAGSRDEAKGVPYCSKICCMYTAKHAILLSEKVPDSQSFIFYIDIRTPGKGYEEFYKRAQSQHDAQYIRGRVAKIYPKGDRYVVQGQDTLLGAQVEIEADMVVLAAAVVPQDKAKQLAQTLSISYDEYGFYSESHPKLRPVDTQTGGIFLAGACQGPKDIPESVAQASAAAAKVAAMFSKVELESNPMIATVNESLCSGCFWCKPICPYQAISEKEIVERIGRREVKRKVSSINPALCQGCGACSVACRDGAMDLLGFSNEQILAEVDALCL